MESGIRKIYDNFALTYEANRCLFDMSEILKDFYATLNCPSGRLLDLGCGAGEPFARYFLDRGWQVSGVDFSVKMLELAARYAPEMKTYLADMRQIDFPEAHFSAVTAIYCIFHLPHRDHRELFRKIYNWLTPGGKFLFTYGSKAYTGSEEFDGYKEFMGQLLYYSHMSTDKLLKLLRSIGYQIETALEREIGGETFLWISAIKPENQLRK
ncbi:MAG: class I SAM-dependent methyltransferase [Candidatus Cloacimonetes bacterium]|nr:class I SAM-dependent methyltransferase [Candidatus Cloacimonadota bacterium]